MRKGCSNADRAALALRAEGARTTDTREEATNRDSRKQASTFCPTSTSKSTEQTASSQGETKETSKEPPSPPEFDSGGPEPGTVSATAAAMPEV